MMKPTVFGMRPARIAALVALAGVAGIAACDSEPPAPRIEQTTAVPPQTGAAPPTAPGRATEPATGQAASAKARPEPAPSTADSDLAKKVKAALTSDAEVNELEIDVVAKQGAVTLYGTARTRAMRERAERVAARVEGVKSVANKLAVVAGS